MWDGTDYQGLKSIADCTAFGGEGWFAIPGPFANSAKNRCFHRVLRLGNSLIVTACINPGGNRASVANSDRFKVGQLNSLCG